MQKPIVIFDSGVGGLSVYLEVKRQLPGLDVVYCADNEGFPYGPKSESEVVQRTLHCLSLLSGQYNPGLVVIACNTASTISLPHVRQHMNIPVVGVVPAIKPAGEWSKKRCIGLLATPGTIEREYTHQLIRDFARDCKVISVGSGELVNMAERQLRHQPVSHEEYQRIMQPFFEAEHSPDCIVLGCTHFPLVRKQLQQASPAPLHWIDSGEAIARRVGSLLEELPVPGDIVESLFTYTGSDKNVQPLLSAIKEMGFGNVSALE